MGLQLGEDVSKMIDSVLIQSLQLFKDIRRLILPFSIDCFGTQGGIAHILCMALSSLDFLNSFLRGVELLCDSAQIALDCSHCLHLSVIPLILPQRPLNVGFHIPGEGSVGIGERLGGGDDILPWCLEDSEEINRNAELMADHLLTQALPMRSGRASSPTS